MGPATELDVSRLEAIGVQLGQTAGDVAATLRMELARALDEIDAGVDAGDGEAIAIAAHAARNSALMIAARPTLAVLDKLESAARVRDLPRAAAAAHELQERWTALRAQLDRAIDPAQSHSR
jgi:hypothetical protein